MKQYLTMFFFFVVIATLTISAQDTRWKISNYPLSDDDLISEGITEMLTAGYFPVGIEVLAGQQLSIMYEQFSFEADRFYLHFFSDISTMSQDFAAFLNEGWAPSDVAFVGSGMLALFMESETEFGGWTMMSVDGQSAAEQQQNIRTMVFNAGNQGYLPFGLTRYDGKLMIAFTSANRGTHAGVSGEYRIEAYPNDGNSFVIGINSRLDEGYHISGYHFNNGQIYIAYLK